METQPAGKRGFARSRAFQVEDKWHEQGPEAGGFWLVQTVGGSGPRREVPKMARRLGLSRACSALWILTRPERSRRGARSARVM